MTIRIQTSRPYDVHIGEGLLRQAGELLEGCIKPCKVALISDAQVYALYGQSVCASLLQSGYEVCVHTFPPGEASKSIMQLESIWSFLSQNGVTRQDLIVALGGGVTGDLAGFAAACYQRGIPFVQMPTTLLSAVDSSVGGKTAVNLPEGKNQVGAFWQPALVLCDCDTFQTLSKADFASGAAECIKHGMLCDAAYYRELESGALWTQTPRLAARSVEIKASYVIGDEQDKGKRNNLNFGHTPAHGIELLSGFTIPHGHAVAMGMRIMTRAAERMGICQEGTASRLAKALDTYGLLRSVPYTAKDIASAAYADKKRMGDIITLIVPEKIGACTQLPVALEQVESIFALGMEA